MEFKSPRNELATLVLFILFLTGPANSQQGNCKLRGQIYTSLNWYGYLLQKTFQGNASRIQYAVSFPASECCANMLIYYDGQIRNLTQDMTCEQRDKVLNPNNQIIPLNLDTGVDGCIRRVIDGTDHVFCVGDRTLKSTSPRMWYVALSRCGATGPITVRYEFNLTGYYGACEEDPLARTLFPPQEVAGDTSAHLSIGLGVLAGIAIIVAVLFIVLFIVNRRQMRKKPKTSGSVTSSQATMTQDIFYVNPSLSDRGVGGEHSDSQYSRSSSENYYEVIPDRRSYESINTQLALHGGRAINIPREHRTPRIPSYIFEDVPPPPYQPPNMQGSGHQHQGSGSSSGHHSSQGSGSGHPLLATQSPYSVGGLQHVSLQTRFVPISSAQGLPTGPVTMATTTTRMPIHSNGPLSSAISNSSGGPQAANHTSAGIFHSSATGTSATEAGNQNGGINSLAGGLTSRETLPSSRAQISEVNGSIQLQSGGPAQNGTLGRYGGQHAKLLNHNYRIQQFETTA
ncbi:TM145-like protein [Mya arenaria]|uniref:TM145-like protein n=1 Tax=Mya arenaria TaxID=6604 RepID=A0ABY7G7J8_MYAAR|nr:uncharacterized protein LOC128221065 [Mya arenaria]XP_052785450.1 uncharacterized protein LOC128221065 [Mya arenaria]XP_052785451.1 uncharacterized protein LOC128221065 [Mya arenaria]XP_052785452.1 uncharacterized protein LOC128221065 [Mya arenaria]XP_052785453.1 uncharacterized protein LOC128221065 [Mya arenaria]XP_052785454.1 uncharacterized protein LOC128221065 [Mya arenaria]XP_052785455.1 uncharacterized protein LOC128221065 [Mya arenaria]XP_052785456.1 uncharacterized protein LOC1282